MRFVCESCRAQYMINDDKVGPKGVKVRCKKCGYVILVKKGADGAAAAPPAPTAEVPAQGDPEDGLATQVFQSPLATKPEAPAMAELAGHEADGRTTELPSVLFNKSLEDDDPKTVVPPPKAEERNEKFEPSTLVAAPPKSRPEKTDSKESKAVKRDVKLPEKLAEAPKSESFFGADEDEIGAVFDQVLATGPAPVPAPDDDDDDRMSTKLIDADVVRKLAADSGDQKDQKKDAEKPKEEEVPQTDWYVAINDKQTGPLTLQTVKDHWDKGEIGPDSLCWRAGFADWIPLSDVKTLASVLAPKPPKPIVVAATAPSVSAVMSVPVQSAFSAGGVVQTVQSEMQVPIAAKGVPFDSVVEHTGTWKPSAASALASLVKDEMEALAKPPPAAPKNNAPAFDDVPVNGLLDLPGAEERPANGFSMAQLPPIEQQNQPAPVARPAPQAPQAPVNPYMSNPGATFSAPAVTSYRPPSNRGLVIAVVAGLAVMLIVLVGLVVWLATKQPPAPPVVVQAPVPVAPTPTPPAPTPVAVAPTTPPVAVAPPTPPPTTPPPAEAAPTTPPPAADTKPVDAKAAEAKPADTKPAEPLKGTEAPKAEPKAVVAAKTPKAVTAAPKTTTVAAVTPPPPPEKKEPPAKVEKAAPAGDDGDDFAKAFGGGSTKAAPKAAVEATPPPKKSAGYIPAAPGGASDVKDSLQQSDIMEVVLANKAALGTCVSEQKKREPGVSGKLVMKWQIQTTGKTSNVSVSSEEFKGTYVAGCIGGLIKGWTFPRHKTQGEPVSFPFKF